MLLVYFILGVLISIVHNATFPFQKFFVIEVAKPEKPLSELAIMSKGRNSLLYLITVQIAFPNTISHVSLPVIKSCHF